jgi:hypothetical protein
MLTMTITLTRSALAAQSPCASGLALFDYLAQGRESIALPPAGDTWTLAHWKLADLWLRSSELSRNHYNWLTQHGWPAQSFDGARLDGASLDGASLDGARLECARLDGARLVRASLVRAIPLPWDGEAARAGLATASAEMVAWAKSVREPTAEELAVAEARTDAIKAALYPSPPGQALPVELQVNVTISGAPNAGALSDAIVDACREIAERGA